MHATFYLHHVHHGRGPTRHFCDRAEIGLCGFLTRRHAVRFWIACDCATTIGCTGQTPSTLKLSQCNRLDEVVGALSED